MIELKPGKAEVLEPLLPPNEGVDPTDSWELEEGYYEVEALYLDLHKERGHGKYTGKKIKEWCNTLEFYWIPVFISQDLSPGLARSITPIRKI